jgi:hypothetical protein
MPDIKFQIHKNLGTISESAKGWSKELNLISWNDKEPKYDIREWDSNHEKMGKGCTFSKEELISLRNILNDMELEEEMPIELPGVLNIKPPKRKCPACGSSKVVSIVYGYTSHELFEAAERGEVALGGCCIGDFDNTCSCRECGKSFGGGVTPGGNLRNDIKSFLFCIGGFNGTNHFVYVDSDGANPYMRYVRSEGYLNIDIRDKIPEEYYALEGVDIKEENWQDKLWNIFNEELLKCNVDYWAESYSDNEILDGTQWQVVMEYKGEKLIRQGSNEYPPAWKKFMRVMRKYINNSIG